MPATDCAIAELIGLLMDQSISVLADVRQFPGLKRQPQFAKDSLESSLREVVIGYRHFEALGGRRTAKRIGIACAQRRPLHPVKPMESPARKTRLMCRGFASAVSQAAGMPSPHPFCKVEAGRRRSLAFFSLSLCLPLSPRQAAGGCRDWATIAPCRSPRLTRRGGSGLRSVGICGVARTSGSLSVDCYLATASPM